MAATKTIVSSIQKIQPHIYYNHNVRQRHDTKYLLSKFAHLVNWLPNGNDVVLDVGCGTGDVTWDMVRPLLPPSARLIGSDVSKEMLQFARKQYPQLEFTALDIGAPKMPDCLIEKVDHLFSFYCLHWLMDQKKMIMNLFNLLKPGGDMLVCYMANNPVYDAFFNLSKKITWAPFLTDVEKFVPPFYHIPDIEGYLKKIMEDVGFKTTVCLCEDKYYDYESYNLFKSTMMAVQPAIITKLPEEMKEKYFNDFAKEFQTMKVIKEINFDKTGPIGFRYRLVSIFATKPL